MARGVMNQLVRYGEVRRGRLGIEMVDLTPDIAKKLGTALLEGALIASVQAGSPAEKAGLRERDIIVGMNGRPIRSPSELRARLGLTPVGDEVELKIQRGAEARTLRMKIAAPQQPANADGQAVAQLPGMRVVEIERGSPLYRQIQGLVVASIEANSRAFAAGFRPGDIIYGVNRRRVKTLGEFQAALKAAEKGPFAVNLIRGETALNIVVR